MEQIILIYCKQITTRLNYILDWIFREQLGIDYRVTYNKEEYIAHSGMKINYSHERLQQDGIYIIPHQIMWENGEKEQQLNINRWKKSFIIFYNQPGALIPFDLFAACFYFLSRYEEYLPPKKDKHGRYAAQNSIAMEYSFIQQPVVDEWIFHFSNLLARKFSVQLPLRRFEFLPTYDIDIAYAYRFKPRVQNWGGALKDLLKLRLDWTFDRAIVTNSKRVDPYDAYAWLDEAHEVFNLHPIYFFLVGKPSTFDRNIDPSHPAMQLLMAKTSQKYSVGLHPSYMSHNQTKKIVEEKAIVEAAIDRKVIKSRQHYLRFALPEGYRHLIDAGIEEDYSMGYGEVNGFRAGTSQPFLWYDLSREQKTNLRVHPFCFMDSTAINTYGSNKKEAYNELERILFNVKKINGRFVSIFHNNNLGRGREQKGWNKVYRKLIEKVQA